MSKKDETGVACAEPTSITTFNCPMVDLSTSSANRRGKPVSDEIREMAASIREVGLLQPIGVRSLVTDGASRSYEIVWGETRYHACKLLGWGSIPAVLTDSDRFHEMRAIENAQRTPLSTSQEGDVLLELIKLADPKGERPPQAIRDVAARLGKSPEWVATRLSVRVELAPKVQELVDSGRLPIHHARVLARLADPEAQLNLARRAARGQDGTNGRPLDWLRRQVEQTARDISKAPWDPTLPIGKCRPCVWCPSNSASRPAALFPEEDDADMAPTCGDKACWGAKSRATARVLTLTVSASTPIDRVDAGKDGLNHITSKKASAETVKAARDATYDVAGSKVPGSVVRESVLQQRIKEMANAKPPKPGSAAKVAAKGKKKAPVDPKVIEAQQAWDRELDKYETACTTWTEGVMEAASKSKDKTLKAALVLAFKAEDIEYGPARNIVYKKEGLPILKPAVISGHAGELLSAALSGKISRVVELAKITNVTTSSAYFLARTNVPDRLAEVLGKCKPRPQVPAALQKPRPGAAS